MVHFNPDKRKVTGRYGILTDPTQSGSKQTPDDRQQDPILREIVLSTPVTYK